MSRIRGILVAALLIWSPVASLGDETAREAQSLLNELGYAVGTVDGQWGRKSNTALAGFYEARGEAYDGSLDAEDVSLLREAAEPYRLAIRFPGRLFDLGAARATSCNNLQLGRFSAAAIDAGSVSPIAAFDDSASIGTSAKAEAMLVWARTLSVLAASAATQGNDEAAEAARKLLLSWAEAKAGMQTRIDSRYLGRGNAGGYDPEAAAPVLDMQNATILGGVALIAQTFLADRLTVAESATVKSWALGLIERYDQSGGTVDGTTPGVYLSYYPTLVATVIAGDEAAYKSLVQSLYALFRNRIDDKGAILKNANRGDRALNYQSMGILAVMSTMELVEAQGSKLPADIEAKLHAAVTFLLDGHRDVRLVRPYAKMGYNNPGRGQKMELTYLTNADHYWWMVAYIARYADNDNAMRLRALLAENDGFERVDANIIPSSWIPYPINCFRTADLSAPAMQTARAFVALNYPAIELPPANSFRKGKPKPKGAVAIKADSAVIRLASNGGLYSVFNVSSKGLEVDGTSVNAFDFQVLVDFAGGSEPRNMTLLRILIPRWMLNGDGRKANYLSCGQVAAQAQGDEQQVRLHIGEHTESNACILNKMDAPDRKIWASVLAGLEGLIELADDSKARTELRTLYRFMVY